MSKSKVVKLFLASLLIFSSGICHAQDPAIPAADMAQIQRWLSANDQYRLADLNDCKCDDQIKEVRKGDDVYKPVPNYLPYYAAGNFNGLPSFAVIVLKKQEPFQANQVKIIVFAKDDNVSPVTVDYPFIHDQNLSWLGLFVRPKNKKSDRLLIGVFGSEGKFLKIPPRKSK